MRHLIASGIEQVYNRIKLVVFYFLCDHVYSFLVQSSMHCSRMCFLFYNQLLFKNWKCCSWPISVCIITYYRTVMLSAGTVRLSVSKVWTMPTWSLMWASVMAAPKLGAPKLSWELCGYPQGSLLVVMFVGWICDFIGLWSMSYWQDFPFALAQLLLLHFILHLHEVLLIINQVMSKSVLLELASEFLTNISHFLLENLT